MLKSERADLEWQALRYAVDMIDIAWSYESRDYSGTHMVAKELEMKTRRDELVRMQDLALKKKHAYEEIEK